MVKNLDGYELRMDLFGKKRIQELEETLAAREKELKEKIQKLEQQKEKEQKRAREAVTEKQEADKKINRLKDKVRSLKDRIETQTTQQDEKINERYLTRSQTLELIENIDAVSYNSSKATTVYSTPEKSIIDSDTGEAIFEGPYVFRHAIKPPLELQQSDCYRSDSFITEALHELLTSRYCFLHISSGGSGIAILEDGVIETSSILEADIKAQHTKGGYSQQRFERRRDEQIEEHLQNVKQEASEYLDKGFRTLCITGSTELVGRLRSEIEHDTTVLTSSVSQIKDEDDLQNSFEAGFRFQLRPLSEEERITANERL